MSKAVEAFQAYLQATSPTAAYIKVDGLLGPKTVSAYEQAVRSGDELVTHVAKKLGVVMPKRVLWSKLNPLIASASAQYAVPEEYFVKTILLENRSIDASTIEVEYEGSHRGLGQFDRPTWQGAFASAGLSAPPYEVGTVDDVISLQAIALLYLDNKRQYLALAKTLSSKTPFTLNIAYFYHNQGGPRAAKIIQGTAGLRGQQSDKAVPVAMRAVQEVISGVDA